MLWRRYLAGRWPLLAWARSEHDADVTAVIHSLCLDVATRRLPCGHYADPSFDGCDACGISAAEFWRGPR